jgi:glycosyltransferase involved in cell wall biosynthesis
MIKINVLLASFNGMQFLRDQIQSIADQEKVHVSLFIADDGSTDSSQNLIQSLTPNGAIKNIVIQETLPNMGAASIFLSLLNYSVTHSLTNENDLFAFSDQDDIWFSDKLIKAAQAFEIFSDNMPILYGGRTKLVNTKLRETGYSPLFKKTPSFKNAIVQSLMGGNTMVFNLQAAKLISIVPKQVEQVSMHDIWAYQIVSGAGGIVIYDEVPFILYRQHANNLLGANSGWASRVKRFIRLMSGGYKRSNHVNLNVLQANKHLLTIQNQQILEEFLLASNSNLLFTRIKQLRSSGVYRQTFAQNIMLWFACFLKKL